MAAVIPRTGSPLSFFVAAPGSIGKPSPLLADNIDPTTHDFKSLAGGIDPIDSQVITALSILRGSGASVFEEGLAIGDTKILPTTRLTIESSLREALSTLISNRDIDYRGVDFGSDGIDPANQQVDCLVQWVNLRALDRAVRTSPFLLNSSREV